MPSNPTTPSHPASSTSTASSARDTLSIVQSGVEELLLTDGVLEPEPSPQPPTLPSTLTPAPVTVVRTPSPLANQSLQTSAAPDQHPVTNQHMISAELPPPPSLSSAPMGLPGANQNPAAFQQSPAVSMPYYPSPAAVSIPITSTTSGQAPPYAGTTQGVSFTSSLSEVPVSHTASGLPTLPPTISLPTVAPTINFGPSPFLPAATTS